MSKSLKYIIYRRIFLLFTILGSISCHSSSNIESSVFFELNKKLIKYQYQHEVSSQSPNEVPFDVANNIHNEPSSVASLNELAALFLNSGKKSGNAKAYARAEELAKKSLALRSTFNSDAEMVLARIADAKHRFSDAIIISKKIIAEKPDHYAARQLLVLSLLGQGHSREALDHTNYLIRHMPVDRAQLLHALVLEQLGRDQEAMYYFTRSFQLEDLGDPEAASWKRLVTARFLLKHGCYEQANELVQSALAISKTYQTMAKEISGNIALDQMEWKKAANYFREAFEESKRPKFLTAQANAIEMDGRKEAAVELRNLAFAQMDIEENDLGHVRDLIELLLDRGGTADLEAARNYSLKDLETRTDAKAYWQLAVAERQLNSMKNAVVTIEKALATGYQNPAIYLTAAEIYEKSGDPAKSAHYRKLAAILNPGLKVANSTPKQPALAFTVRF